MSSNKPELNNEEALKAENDFLKMKMMLERGAQFGMLSDECDPKMENEFLNYIMEFEKQAEYPTYVKVYDKIGKPTHFRPVTEIADDEMEMAWDELSGYLYDHGVSIDVCSPNVSIRELYRFTTEELFQEQMTDINIPGMISGFIYDEFHPDPVFDNSRVAIEECMEYILEKMPFQWTHNFRKENLRLNNISPLTIEEFTIIINRFKLAHDDLVITNLEKLDCTVKEKESWVTGIYDVRATAGKECFSLTGSWKVGFEKDDEMGYWYIHSVDIGGIHF